ncbi:hypothetical protein Q2T40_11605 [Winogradskyella maritima]|uniref:Uncharacterized protein n=1 Tax=Winogradskyella maritima TaxID=1517766 RepID=A0ABV8AHY6_9FLAO|nr:hypothetical protein [Winogradskyella maritima]
MFLKNLTRLSLAVAIASGTMVSCSDDDTDGNQSANSTFVYASNNSNGNITVYDVSNSASVSSSSFITASLAADGIYADGNGTVFQASRTDNGLEGFSISTDLVSGTAVNVSLDGPNDMSSPREVAVNGNLFVVADNADVDGDTNTPDGRLFIYSMSNGEFTLRNTVTTNFKVWGITFNGNDLYAVVDATNELALFANFLATNTADATVTATKRIAIEGIVRTHGLTYDVASDVMVMTDIGQASNGQDDGGFHIIENFTSKFNSVMPGGTLSVAQQTRVSGAATLMGNPVDVAYDSATQNIFIAEAGNGGGRILGFSNTDAGGNITPFFNSSLASASSVFLSKQ